MNHEDWNDKRIEELLSKIPKIHDTRSKEEVFERLKKDGIFEEEPPEKKKHHKIIPWMIAACAVVFIAILLPLLIKNPATDETTQPEGASNTPQNQEMKTFDYNQKGQQEQLDSSITTMADLKTAVYPEELEGNTLFRIGLASDDADSIPVTILIPNTQILRDFGKSDPTQVELYNVYASRLNERLLGFMEYHPYAGEISERGDTVVHKLPENHPYDTASATLSTYYASLIDTFTDYRKIEFVDENNQPLIFKEVGEEYPLQMGPETRQYAYFKYVQNDGSEFLAPNFRETFPTVEQAMEALKTSTNDIYRSVILPNADYSAVESNGVVRVTFSNPLDLSNYNQVEAMQMIEGMLLTAAGFGKSVQFENIVQSDWQGFDFRKPLPIPAGPNKLPYTVLMN